MYVRFYQAWLTVEFYAVDPIRRSRYEGYGPHMTRYIMYALRDCG
jgi:hypothetical protein